MATRYAVATGSWSSTSTWDGGTLPQPSDDVYANGFTVTINVTTIDVNFISTEVCPITTIGGGGFTITVADTYYFLCDLIAGSTNLLTYSASGIKVYVYGDVYGGTSGNAIYATNTAANPASTTPEVIGNVYGGSGANSYGITGNPSRAINPVITGNVYAGVGSPAIVSATAYVATINITGNVYGDYGTDAIVMSGTLNVIGSINAGPGCSGVNMSTVGARLIEIDGYLNNSGGATAVRGNLYLTIPSGGTLEWVVQDDVNNNILLRTPISGGNYPIEGNVRTGTIYGSVSEFTGTCDVPTSSSVAVGVPVDNTVGTAMITITDMGTLLTSFKIS